MLCQKVTRGSICLFVNNRLSLCSWEEKKLLILKFTSEISVDNTSQRTETMKGTPKTKANIGLSLTLLFLITFITGIILHLKKHGIIVEPRPVIKMIHWIAGFLMIGFATVHGLQFKKMFSALKVNRLWFHIDTWVVIIFTALAFLTGLVKLLSPVKIPNLGMHHYWFGIIMSVAIAVHLIRGIPSWNRLRKIKK